MRKQVELNGEMFTVVKGSGAPYRRAWMVEDCYGRCSDIKKAIWHDWLKWAHDLEKQEGISEVTLWVSSYNSNVFTIGGEIEYEDGSTQHIYITKTRQEIW